MANLTQYVYRGAKDASERQPCKRAPHGHDHGCNCDRCVAYWDGWQSGINDAVAQTLKGKASL